MGLWLGSNPILALTLTLTLSPIAKILEDNRLMGRRRVDSWRLSRSLEEVPTMY